MSYFLDYWWSPNYNAGNWKKRGFVIHHAATTNFNQIGQTFQNTAAQTSAHYGVEPGHVQQYVHDKDIAWHSGSAQANRDYIGIECVNSTGSPSWNVSEGTIDTLVEFLTDKCKELGIEKLVVGQNLFGHKDFSATFCPGVLYPRLNEIANRVNDKLNGGQWVKDKESWWYKYADGSYPANQWLLLDAWYWFKSDGYAAENEWRYINGNWYYFDENCRMCTGWCEINNKWYWLDPSDGHMLTGWIKVEGKQYYLDDTGAMRTGWNIIDKTPYLLNDSGALVTGEIEAKLVYDSDGYLVSVK